MVVRFVSTPRDGGHIDLGPLRYALLRADLGTVKPLRMLGRPIGGSGGSGSSGSAVGGGGGGAVE